MYQEFNFDGIVGPTHNYSGLSIGNLASTGNRAQQSHPRAAALQGLAKAMALAGAGVPQAVLPPLQRPSIKALRDLGFDGRDEPAILARAAREAPELMAAVSSASNMWTANAATVAPSCDSADGKLHISPANLSSKLHRALEAESTTTVLRAIFNDPRHFVVHNPLPAAHALRDEGAANHTRLCAEFKDSGLHLFVYGVDENSNNAHHPARFPARQTRMASEAIARRHQLPPDRCLFIQQHPSAIDAGVFHNDVISVGHRNVLLYHELAFLNGHADIDLIQAAWQRACDLPLFANCVPADRVSLEECVRSYLFNSQLVSCPDDRMLLVAPIECHQSSVVNDLIHSWINDLSHPISAVRFFDLRESMRNGGGPACLRQRVVLSDAERAAIQARVFLDEPLYRELCDWVNLYYREELSPSDLADPRLLDESYRALDHLTTILNLGSIYDFQV